jgi:hypothetical protein
MSYARDELARALSVNLRTQPPRLALQLHLVSSDELQHARRVLTRQQHVVDQRPSSRRT